MVQRPRVDGYDVVIVGGGAAGLSAALVLGRCRRRVLVLDAGRPRNTPAAHAQGFLTRDGTPPGELLAAGRAECRRYGVELLTDPAVAVRPHDDAGFMVRTSGDRRLHARRLLVCSGVSDRLAGLDLPGLAARWGRDVVHCPFCHGWEARDRPAVVLAGTPLDLHKAVLATSLTDRITVLTDGVATVSALAAEPDGRLLADAGVPMLPGPAVGLTVRADRLVAVRTADGTVVEAGVVYCTPPVAAADGLLTVLGAATTGSAFGELVAVDADGATSVPGVWAAGNVVDPSGGLSQAAGDGSRAAQAIAASLAADDLRRRAA